MKKLQLSKLDIGIIIAFVVIGLLGGGVWYYLSQNLATAQAEVGDAETDFQKNSNSSGSQKIVVSTGNRQVLQDDIDLLTQKLNPVIQGRLHSKESKLYTVVPQDPVAWKHDLDDEVRRLTNAAKIHGVKLPPNFYFSFSRYLNSNPEDEQTVVLKKQLLAVEQISDILLNAPVKSINSIRRTYEEDPHTPDAPGGSGNVPDRLSGYSYVAGSDIYTDYPFEVEFDANTETLRKVMDDLVQSPYVFVVRTLNVQNLKPTSPQLGDLDKIAGTGSTSVVNSSPGEVAATTSVQGPQFLFGDASLRIKARIDLIEWNADSVNALTPAGGDGKNPSSGDKK